MRTLHTQQKGFTLIELLIVIAIIGILSAILIPNLIGARNKAIDASLKATMSGMKAQALLYADGNNGSFTGLCQDDEFDRLLIESAKISSGVDEPLLNTHYFDLIGMGSDNFVVGGAIGLCHDVNTGGDGSKWAAAFMMTDGTSSFCVDSLGQGLVLDGSNGEYLDPEDRNCDPNILE